MGMALLELSQVSLSTRCLFEALVIAVERDLNDLVEGIVSMLRQAHKKDRETVTSVWRQLTGEDLPRGFKSQTSRAGWPGLGPARRGRTPGPDGPAGDAERRP